MTESASRAVVSAVVGTAGHIDHGKSSLVEQLTGVHPSRLAEERERGMTIDIGYAEFPVAEGISAGIIDVPGHERFIRNMVAGAAGIDFVILVVAADDGVMTQTREHLQILRLLGIRRGMTVLTKIDIVDPELLEIVRDDVTEYLEGTFLAGRAPVPVSNITGEGIDDVARILREELLALPSREGGGVFRMPIQRAFSVQGHGTVVTGVGVAGKVTVGDELEILPAGAEVRVRGLQVHHAPAQSAHAGQRTAVNVTDVSYRDIERGDVLAARGYFRTARFIEARLEYLDHHEKPLENGAAVRFHTGCSDVGGEIILLEDKNVIPGQSALVQLRLEEAVVVAPNDRFVVRLQSPVVTLGGGVVLGTTKWRFKRFKEWLTENMAAKEENIGNGVQYLEYVVRSQGAKVMTVDEAARAVQRSESEALEDLRILATKGRVRHLGRERFWIHQEMFRTAVRSLSKAMLAMHDEDRLVAGFHPSGLERRTMMDRPLIDAIVQELSNRGKVEILGDQRVRHLEYRGSLSKEDMRLVRQIESMHEENPFGSPIMSEMTEKLGKPKKKVKELVVYLIQLGTLVPLSADLAIHRGAALDAEEKLVRRILEGGAMPSKDFKDVISATRKYVIPLLEHFDKKGVTRRTDNERSLMPDWRERVYPETAAAIPE